MRVAKRRASEICPSAGAMPGTYADDHVDAYQAHQALSSLLREHRVLRDASHKMARSASRAAEKALVVKQELEASKTTQMKAESEIARLRQIVADDDAKSAKYKEQDAKLLKLEHEVQMSLMIMGMATDEWARARRLHKGRRGKPKP